MWCTQPLRQYQGRKRGAALKKCVSIGGGEGGGGHTRCLELQRKPLAFSKSDNMRNPDDLVTDESTQGPDSK